MRRYPRAVLKGAFASMIDVICPLCNEALKVPEDDIGITGVCAKCNGHIAILEAIDPTPRSEAPVAALKSDAGHAEWGPLVKRLGGKKLDAKNSAVLQRQCLKGILINLNQVAHLFLYKRNEFPETDEFLPERRERAHWEETMGAFGHVLLDSNIQRRLDNVRDALRVMPDEGCDEIRQPLLQGLNDPQFISRMQIALLMKKIKARLAAQGGQVA